MEENGKVQGDPCDGLIDDLFDVLKRYSDERGVSNLEILGALEVVKFGIMSAFSEGADEDDDEKSYMR